MKQPERIPIESIRQVNGRVREAVQFVERKLMVFEFRQHRAPTLRAQIECNIATGHRCEYIPSSDGLFLADAAKRSDRGRQQSFREGDRAGECVEQTAARGRVKTKWLARGGLPSAFLSPKAVGRVV